MNAIFIPFAWMGLIVLASSLTNPWFYHPIYFAAVAAPGLWLGLLAFSTPRFTDGKIHWVKVTSYLTLSALSLAIYGCVLFLRVNSNQ